MREKEYEAIKEICDRALEGKISIEEFFEKWPQQYSDGFLKIVFEDIEDAVEHFPASLITKRVDLNAWNKSTLCITLLIDRELLKLVTIQPQRLLESRNIAIKMNLAKEEEIKKFIGQQFVDKLGEGDSLKMRTGQKK